MRGRTLIQRVITVFAALVLSACNPYVLWSGAGLGEYRFIDMTIVVLNEDGSRAAGAPVVVSEDLGGDAQEIFTQRFSG